MKDLKPLSHVLYTMDCLACKVKNLPVKNTWDERLGDLK